MEEYALMNVKIYWIKAKMITLIIIETIIEFIQRMITILRTL